MYKKNKIKKTKISMNKSTEGEMLETKIERRLANKEPMTGEAPLIFTERAEGVLVGHNIRTDRFEIALNGVGAIQKSQDAKRDNNPQMHVIKDDNKSGNNIGDKISEA